MSKYIYLKRILFTVTLFAFAGIPMNAEATVSADPNASSNIQTISLSNGIIHLVRKDERKKWKRERKKLKRERRKLRSERRRWRDDDYYGRGGYYNPGHGPGDVLNLFGGIAGAIAGNQNRGRRCAVKGTRDGYFYKPGDYGYHDVRPHRWFCSGRQARNNGYVRG